MKHYMCSHLILFHGPLLARFGKSDGNGSMAYLDYSSLNRENEPRVLAAFYNGKKFEVTETVAEDLGDFILGLVQEQVE